VRFVVPSVDLRAWQPPHAATKLLTKKLCEQHGVVPVSVGKGVLIIASAVPDDAVSVIAELEVFTGLKIEVVRATELEIRDTIRNSYGAES
jgi:hypothetical protein